MCERIFAGLDSNCNQCETAVGFCETCQLVQYATCCRCGTIAWTPDGQIAGNGDFLCAGCANVCADCGAVLDNDAIEIDGALFCENCVKTCPDCGAVHRYEDSIGNRCEDCSNDVFYCERCSDYEPNDEAVLVRVGYRREEMWCRYCADHYATACDDCGDYWADDADIIYRDSTGWAYCPSCMDERGVCADCGVCLPYDMLYYRERLEEHYCSRCDPGEEEEDKPGTLHSYGFNPRKFIFHGEGPAFAGVELEVEGNDGQGDVCDVVERIDGQENYFYCKEDSSLGSSGVEIVGMPMQWDVAQNMWTKVLERIQGKAKSHDTTTCGLHVHVTRSAHSVDTWEKVCLFVDLHWSRFVTLARRESEHYAKKLRSENPCYCMQKGAGRYWALNFENEDTVEWRLWRGTLKPDTFFACVACSLALPEYISQADDCYGWHGFMDYCALHGYSDVSNYFNK